MLATNFIENAFNIFSIEMKKEILNEINNYNQELCNQCSENLQKMKDHDCYKKSTPLELHLDPKYNFKFDLDGFITISEHWGMPAIQTHHNCPTCFTDYHYYNNAYDDGVFTFSPNTLEKIEDFESFFENKKTSEMKKFANFLNDYIKDKPDILTFYAVMDEKFKRSNHGYLTKQYLEDNKDLESLNFLHLYFSEKGLFSSSRMGGIFIKSFIQSFEYPLKSLQFEYCDYFERINVDFDTRLVIENSNLFFDVYKKDFVKYSDLNLSDIHMIKRNADTYSFCSDFRDKNEISSQDSNYEIDLLFSNWFSLFSKDFLTEKFKSEYIALLKEREESSLALSNFLKNYRDSNKPFSFKETSVPKELEHFSICDTVIVNNSLFNNKKACITNLNYSNLKMSVVFYDDKYGEYEVEVFAKDCSKL